MQRWHRVIFVLILIIGLSMRFWQHFMGRGLWEDECHLALNFLKYDLLRLLQPLDHIQAAPVLFIVLTKIIISVFGTSEIAFRTLPFVMSVLSLPLLYFAVVGLTRDRIVALLTFLVFAVGVKPIYFSSELKQYGVDLSVTIILIFVAVSDHAAVTKHRRWLLIVAGCLGLLLSTIASVPLLCIGLYRLYRAPEKIKWFKEDFMIYFPWLVTTLLNYYFFVYDHPSTIDQKLNYAFAFCPTNIFSAEFANFQKKTFEETFFTMLLFIKPELGFRYITLFLFVFGIVMMVAKRNVPLLIFTILPIFIHLLLSALKLYPFWYRLILYLVPSFMLILVYAVVTICRWISNVHWSLAIPPGAWCLYFFVQPSLEKFPEWPTDIKPALEFVNKYSPKHVYILDPVNAYQYYYLRKQVKDSVYKILPWTLRNQEFHEMTRYELGDHVLFYSTNWQWGYADMIKELAQSNEVVDRFDERGYGVFILRPKEADRSGETIMIDHSFFPPEIRFAEDYVAIWGSNPIVSRPVSVQRGTYRATVTSQGKSLGGIYPLQSLYLNNQKIGEFTSTALSSSSSFTWTNTSDSLLVVKIKLENDANSATEDRNAFIRVIEIRKLDTP